ncbi:MAG: VOC family protein [Proteobacteria bacterium]|nr:VOC family protein [Pseudomonadota bacterium]
MPSPRFALAAALVVLVAAACAQAPGRISAITPVPTYAQSPGRFVWVDLVTHDLAGAQAFYGELFGWSFDADSDGDGYVRVLHQGFPIAGMVDVRRPKGWQRESGWVASLSVSDVDAAAAAANEAGGAVERPPRNVPVRGRMALVSDPAGAHLLLLRAAGGDPPNSEPPPGRFLWNELWTQDVEGAATFYRRVAGYEIESIQLGESPYAVWKRGGVPRAGLIEAPPEVDAQWLPYVRVEDPEQTADRAAELGARVVLRDDDSAIFVDPTGAPLGVQAWSDRNEETQP